MLDGSFHPLDNRSRVLGSDKKGPAIKDLQSPLVPALLVHWVTESASPWCPRGPWCRPGLLRRTEECLMISSDRSRSQRPSQVSDTLLQWFNDITLRWPSIHPDTSCQQNFKPILWIKILKSCEITFDRLDPGCCVSCLPAAINCLETVVTSIKKKEASKVNINTHRLKCFENLKVYLFSKFFHMTSCYT